MASPASCGDGDATRRGQPAACSPRGADCLAVRGDALTRDTLAAQLRRDGHEVRNTKVSQLLVELRKEAHAAPDSRARAT
jgi:hypothetical protein